MSSYFEETFDEKWVSLITNTRQNIKSKVMKLLDRLMFEKRFIINDSLWLTKKYILNRAKALDIEIYFSYTSL
ncbi:hypothetical protein BTN49_2348 [Candidatus Enterovibrio escicola]|uniref:Transposase DDE domain-containing protein n=1 Tax=Candidatus Enterovibrio escicola TaxID=1927127 RepID=A0A2A5T141_9GAMM|nr:hypothetical protein BTN49_2348 [Candidatus Enterovibrio escacola]